MVETFTSVNQAEVQHRKSGERSELFVEQVLDALANSDQYQLFLNSWQGKPWDAARQPVETYLEQTTGHIVDLQQRFLWIICCNVRYVAVPLDVLYYLRRLYAATWNINHGITPEVARRMLRD